LNGTCDGGAEEWLLSSLNIPSRLLQLAQQTKEESLGCFNNLKLYMGGIMKTQKESIIASITNILENVFILGSGTRQWKKQNGACNCM